MGVREFSMTAVFAVLLSCAGSRPTTLADWTLTETRVESLGRVAGLLAADRVKEELGLESDAGERLARAAAALNATAGLLAAEGEPAAEEWEEVRDFLRDALRLSLEREPALAEGMAVMQELAGEMGVNPRARLWLGLFCQSASRSILEVYEDEFNGGGDPGHTAGDPVGDR